MVIIYLIGEIQMKYLLFLDDERNPGYVKDFNWPEEFRNNPSRILIARSTEEALEIMKEYEISYLSLDHDLGGNDTSMRFLKILTEDIWDGISEPPGYYVHSANPVGRDNLISFMESWKKIWGFLGINKL